LPRSAATKAALAAGLRDGSCTAGLSQAREFGPRTASNPVVRRQNAECEQWTTETWLGGLGDALSGFDFSSVLPPAGHSLAAILIIFLTSGRLPPVKVWCPSASTCPRLRRGKTSCWLTAIWPFSACKWWVPRQAPLSSVADLGTARSDCRARLSVPGHSDANVGPKAPVRAYLRWGTSTGMSAEGK
jgi:hypothetical protein